MHKKQKSYFFGLLAEFIAVWFLRLKFYTILAKRYKTKVGEVDIIAVRGNSLIFVEVKARTSKNNPHETVTSHQWRRINRGALVYLSRNRQFADFILRFDLIFITPTLIPRHIISAWEGNYFK